MRRDNQTEPHNYSMNMQEVYKLNNTIFMGFANILSPKQPASIAILSIK